MEETMKSNYTHLILVLDASGSMFPLHGSTIEGVNDLVRKQKDLPGDFTTAMYQFSSIVKEVEAFSILTKHNYIIGGSTALLDAIGTAIQQEGQKLAELPESQRPDKVVVVIVTDGEENCSQEFKIDTIKQMVTTQQDVYKWQFVFLGANIDAFATGGSFGFAQNNSMNFNASREGVLRSYACVTDTLSGYRSGIIDSMDLQSTLKKTDPNDAK
jgi:hypothetical protein